MDYTTQEFEFKSGNSNLSVKGRLKKNLIFWQERLSANLESLKITTKVTRFHSLNT